MMQTTKPRGNLRACPASVAIWGNCRFRIYLVQIVARAMRLRRLHFHQRLDELVVRRIMFHVPLTRCGMAKFAMSLQVTHKLTT